LEKNTVLIITTGPEITVRHILDVPERIRRALTERQGCRKEVRPVIHRLPPSTTGSPLARRFS
jgi:hypothetical protein